MSAETTDGQLQDATGTARAAEQLGPTLEYGDTILLHGPVGAGKTHFARHLIRSILKVPEDIPSPTFTLVQTYETTAGALWHADLYRIGTTHEIEELGLIDAFDSAICIVEWPDRLGSLCPDDALEITLGPGDRDDTRRMRTRWQHPKWRVRMQAFAA